MAKVTCPCVYAHDLTPIPDDGWFMVRDKDYESLIDAHVAIATNKSKDMSRIIALSGRLFDCPQCSRIMISPPGDACTNFKIYAIEPLITHEEVKTISSSEVLPLLAKACPSFQTEEVMLYPAMGEFAQHLLKLHQTQRTETFEVVADVIERLHVEGDPTVREAATIGLLEGIQNIWDNNGVDPSLFANYLRPESRKWWYELNAFWQGKRQYVGEGLRKLSYRDPRE